MRFRLLGLGLLALALPAWPQSGLHQPTALRVAPGEAVPVIDGRLDDGAWLRAPVHERFAQFLPADKEAFYKATQPIRDKYGAKYAALLQKIRDTK